LDEDGIHKYGGLAGPAVDFSGCKIEMSCKSLLIEKSRTGFKEGVLPTPAPSVGPKKPCADSQRAVAWLDEPLVVRIESKWFYVSAFLMQ
jgi:hypothetical protein